MIEKIRGDSGVPGSGGTRDHLDGVVRVGLGEGRRRSRVSQVDIWREEFLREGTGSAKTPRQEHGQHG